MRSRACVHTQEARLGPPTNSSRSPTSDPFGLPTPKYAAETLQCGMLRFVGVARVLVPVPVEKRYSTLLHASRWALAQQRDVFNRMGLPVRQAWRTTACSNSQRSRPRRIELPPRLDTEQAHVRLFLCVRACVHVCVQACVQACVRVFVPHHGCLCPQVVCYASFGVHGRACASVSIVDKWIGRAWEAGRGPTCENDTYEGSLFATHHDLVALL